MTQPTPTRWSIHDRVVATLQRKRPDRHPFIDRIHTWYQAHDRNHTLPAEFHGLSLTEVHRAIGLGQQKFFTPFHLRLRNVELSSYLDGQRVHHVQDPVVEFFPGLWDYVNYEKPGVTRTELKTPVGGLCVRQELLAENVASGTEPYMKEHMIKEREDYRTVEYILEQAEFVPMYDRLYEEARKIGDIGFVVAMPQRIPFQQILLEYLGEVALFYSLHDDPGRVQRLLTILDAQLVDCLNRLAGLDVPYVEFGDNLHGLMTNPRLFRQYCLPYYQRYADLLHAQGKTAGSHTDGNVKPLLGLLAESGLDVCESFSPVPLTPCTFAEAWGAWRDGPIIWGGIPSPILEARYPEAAFHEDVARLLDTIGGDPIILGVGDMVMGHNLIERVRYIADQVEARPLG